MSTETPESTNRPAGEKPETPRRNGRWLKVVLVVSLAINLLVVGAVIGRSSRGPMFHPVGPHAAWSEGRRMFRELPGDRRQIILGAMRSHRDAFDAHRKTVGDARRNAAQVLEREDANPQEIGQAFGLLGREEGGAVEALRMAIGEVVMVMTPQERRAFARRVLGKEPRGFAPSFE